MNQETWQQLKSVFHAALELAPEDRAAFLAQACDGEMQLHAQVAALLRSHEGAGSFLVEPAIVDAGVVSMDGPVPTTEADQRVGQRVGPYEIISELGHGGWARYF
jgi:hypothetical protein